MKEKSDSGDEESKRSQKRKGIDDGKDFREKGNFFAKKLQLEPNLRKHFWKKCPFSWIRMKN